MSGLQRDTEARQVGGFMLYKMSQLAGHKTTFLRTGDTSSPC